MDQNQMRTLGSYLKLKELIPLHYKKMSIIGRKFVADAIQRKFSANLRRKLDAMQPKRDKKKIVAINFFL